MRETTEKANARHPIVIAAGGTGGHIFPALATARILQEKGQSIVWIGTKLRMEATLVPNAGYPIEYLPITGLRGKGALSWLLAPWKITRAVLLARRLLRALNPQMVLAMGGFVSGPVGVAAWTLGIPLVIHEQNSVAGLTNRLLARVATRICTAFPGSFPRRVNTELIGNPVREEMLKLPLAKKRFAARTGPLRILVLGGSQGALIFNQVLPYAFAQLDIPIAIRHQTGQAYFAKAQRHYREANCEAEVVPFIADMAEAYAWADLVIGRSGALTVAEVTAVGVAALFIPFKQAVDDHQTKNAMPLVEAGAARILKQSECRVEVVLRVLRELLNRDQLQRMASRAEALGYRDATQQLVLRCQEVVCCA